jgi:uncharacterized protein YndB with AHSA1/START domain
MSVDANAPVALDLTRVLDAPRDLVFAAWTKPEHLSKWFGPHGFTMPVVRVDLRRGGEWYLEMHGFGEVYPMWAIYEEIVPPERLVFKMQLRDADGHAFLKTLTTVTFAEHGAKTTLRVVIQVLYAGAGSETPLEGMADGWDQTLERLEAALTTLGESDKR